MNPLNVQRLQLPDGRLVTIEGGDAAATARLVSNYLGLPETLPRDGFVRNYPPGYEEPPLPLPVMNFAPPGQTMPQESGSQTTCGEEPALPTPRMDFSHK